MTSARPFRVLILDDDLWEAHRRSGLGHAGDRSQPAYLVQRLRELGEESGGGMEVFLGGEVGFFRRLARLAPARGEDMAPFRDCRDARDRFLQSIDLLVLDLQGLGPLTEPLQPSDLPVEVQPALAKLGPEEALEELNNSYSGVAFYLRFRPLLENCQAVIILTQTESAGRGADSPDAVNAALHPFCAGDHQRPWTVKFRKHDQVPQVVRMVESLWRDFSQGYTQLESRGAIEFAATHDFPVLIVGESGTGKEYLAQAIHHRWAQEQRREGGAEPPFTVVNCAGLSPELARGELFGYLRGSFTGADRHRLGAVLETCGLKPPASKEGVRYQDVEEARQSLTTLADLFDRYEATENEEEKLRLLRTELLPATRRELMGENARRSAFSFFSGLRSLTERSLFGQDDAAHFLAGLHTANPGRLEATANGLRLPAARPVGTLFLDEFGDLPPEVQVLLLRYLETGEVQPLGFAGTIAGARVRLIAATSDPRIAAFVGESLKGGWRTAGELARPFREDLLFRLKGQVIRATPVTEETLPRVLDDIIARSEPYIPWESSARETLLQALRDHLSSIDEASRQSGQGGPAFGHRRELRRLVDLANAWVDTAWRRGLRAQAPRVTTAVIEKVWRPSRVNVATLETETNMALPPVTATPFAHSVSEGPLDATDEAEALTLRSELAALFTEPGLEDNWNGEDFRKGLLELDEETREEVKAVVQRYTGDRLARRKLILFAALGDRPADFLASNGEVDDGAVKRRRGTVMSWFRNG